MLLVIPSISIKDGLCTGKIVFPSGRIGDDVYAKPEDRARLLRKENAKALHLILTDDDAWQPRTLTLINGIREAVDIPIQVSLDTIPDDFSKVRQLVQSGIYRLFLPHHTDDFFLSNCIQDFTKQKVVVSIPIEEVTRVLLDRLKNNGLIRVCVTLADTKVKLPFARLQEIAVMATENNMRLSLLFGVDSYAELIEFARFEPRFDSVILGSALEENSFPCQAIWREMEERAYAESGKEANLWRNPLEHIPHV
ncbi:MAG: HisA/HisF-related TIM barrel protein [Ignavibacteriota bacterium]